MPALHSRQDLLGQIHLMDAPAPFRQADRAGRELVEVPGIGKNPALRALQDLFQRLFERGQTRWTEFAVLHQGRSEERRGG